MSIKTSNSKSIPVSSLKRNYLIKNLLLDRYTWTRKSKKGETKNLNFLSYLITKHFQDKLRAMAHAGLLDVNYKCPYCQSGLVLSKEQMNKLEDQLAKFGNIRTPEVVAQAINKILGITTVEKSSNLDLIQGYTLVGKLYHLDSSKFSHAYKFRSNIRAKTKANYMKFVNGVDVELLTYDDIKDDVEEVSRVYAGLVVGCPACQGFGYLDVGHKNPAGKGIEMVQHLYRLYKKGQKKISYGALWKIFRNLKVEPQIAKRPTTKWADTKINTSTPRDLETGKIAIANQFQSFTNLMSSGITNELARIKHLIETESFLQDQNLITFEQGLNFYDKLIKGTRVDTGTLKETLINENDLLRTRLNGLQYDDTLKVERDGQIQHIIPENFLYISGATSIERTGKSGYRGIGKGKRRYHSTTARPKSNLHKVYAAFFSDLHYGYNLYSWENSGKSLSSIAREVFSPDQIKFLKVFPQFTED